MLGHLRDRPHCPVAVFGPTGCGKTEGVRSILEANRARILWLDGVEVEHGHQLVSWIRRTRQLERDVSGREPVVVVDGLESLTEDALRSLAAYLKRSDVHLGHPLVLTCTELRRSSLRCVAAAFETHGAHAKNPRKDALCGVRLVAPSPAVVTKWLCDACAWTTCAGAATRGFSRGLVAAEAEGFRPGDLRHARTVMEWRVRMQAPLQPSEAVYVNAFDALRRLVLRRVTARWWTEHAEERDADLVRDHVVRLGARAQEESASKADMHVLSSAMEELSQSLLLSPSRFETRSVDSMAYGLSVVAMVVRGHIRPVRDTGMLTVVPWGGNVPPTPPTDPQTRPWTAIEALDVPACLR